MIRRPTPKRPATAHQMALTEDEAHDVIMELQAEAFIDARTDRRLIEAAFSDEKGAAQ